MGGKKRGGKSTKQGGGGEKRGKASFVFSKRRLKRCIEAGARGKNSENEGGEKRREIVRKKGLGRNSVSHGKSSSFYYFGRRKTSTQLRREMEERKGAGPGKGAKKRPFLSRLSLSSSLDEETCSGEGRKEK